MNSQSYDTSKKVRTTGTIRSLAVSALLVTMAFSMCGCSKQADGSIFKVESGQKTLLDIKKDPDEKVSIEVEVPKVDLKLKHDQASEKTDEQKSQ